MVTVGGTMPTRERQPRAARNINYYYLFIFTHQLSPDRNLGDREGEGQRTVCLHPGRGNSVAALGTRREQRFDARQDVHSAIHHGSLELPLTLALLLSRPRVLLRRRHVQSGRELVRELRTRPRDDNELLSRHRGALH
jgi:hypothetical protein